MELRRIGSAKLSDQITAELQSKIIRGEIRPGDRLPTEAELGERLNVSRSAVRDALRTLAARGLVTVRQGYGIEVTTPNEGALTDALVLQIARSDATLGDVMEARAILDFALGPFITRTGNHEDWDRMDAALQEFAAAVHREDWAGAQSAHLTFHEAMFGALHSPLLGSLLRPMHRLTFVSSVPPQSDSASAWDVEAHGPIVEALRSGDEDAVQRCLERHYNFRDAGNYSEFLHLRVSEAFDAGLEYS